MKLKQFILRIISRLYTKKRAKHICIGENTLLHYKSIISNTGAKENITIENDCYIGAAMFTRCGGKIHIGDHVYIGSETQLLAKDNIIIKDHTIISNNVIITDNDNHPTSPKARYDMCQSGDYFGKLWSWEYANSKPIVIGSNVWIGRDSRIMKGVTIGNGSIVALGAIVTKDVAPYSIVAGNPAQVVKKLNL